MEKKWKIILIIIIALMLSLSWFFLPGFFETKEPEPQQSEEDVLYQKFLDDLKQKSDEFKKYDYIRAEYNCTGYCRDCWSDPTGFVIHVKEINNYFFNNEETDEESFFKTILAYDSLKDITDTRYKTPEDLCFHGLCFNNDGVITAYWKDYGRFGNCKIQLTSLEYY